jgi:hypothetical protein
MARKRHAASVNDRGPLQQEEASQMKRLALSTGLLAVTALLAAPVALATDVQPEPLHWATGDTIDWSTGALLALFGFAGALFVVFTLIGGAVPGTAGQADIEAETRKVGLLSDQLSQAAQANPRRPDEIRALNEVVDRARSALSRERWRQFALASSLYVLLGAFVAAVIANDLLQALAIGAGWTGIVGSLGLKRDYSARSDTKDSALSALEQHLDWLQSQAAKPDVEVSPEDVKPEGLQHKVEVAQAL